MKFKIQVVDKNGKILHDNYGFYLLDENDDETQGKIIRSNFNSAKEHFIKVLACGGIDGKPRIGLLSKESQDKIRNLE